jgi:thiamine pyrophosphate-dependent acetolactate synthase large subunit-like protein
MACPPPSARRSAARMLVIDIAGDASIQMNIQELGTATQFRLPVKIFILNNEWMGMVRQWQELTYESRYSSSYSDALPDFVKLAKPMAGRASRSTRSTSSTRASRR